MQTSLPKAVLVTKVIQENFKTKSYVCNEKITALPGQFIMIWLPGVGEKPLSLTDNDPLTFTVSAVGKFTKTLNSTVKPNDKIWYRGPFGNGVFKIVPGKKILVTGGCGCVPVHFLAKTIKDKPEVIVGAKNKAEILFENRFEKLGLKVSVTTDDGSYGYKGFTTDLLAKKIQKEKIACVYACGPEMMLKKIADLCDKFKVQYQLSLEAFMKCGFGVCGSCAKNGKLVCKDGPVFSRWP